MGKSDDGYCGFWIADLGFIKKGNEVAPELLIFIVRNDTRVSKMAGIMIRWLVNRDGRFEMTYQDEHSQKELRADFDNWAQTYDQEVGIPTDDFPFAGYDRALETVWQKVEADPGMSVLDLGIGTGNLAKLFMESGCQVLGVDFSAEMLVKTREKFPKLELVQADLTLDEWPTALNRRFDRIVSNYTFHEFPLETKLHILTLLATDHLHADGRIVIGDVMFPTLPALKKAKEDFSDVWDDEIYWLTDETRALFEPRGWALAYFPVSFCAGVYVFTPPAFDIV